MTSCESKSRSATVASTVACRLEGDDYRRRLAVIGDLARAALLDHTRDDQSICLSYAASAVERVRRIVEEERVCCPFLTIELKETVEAVFVKITPPQHNPPLLDMLFDHFTSGVPPQRCIRSPASRASDMR